MRENESTDRDVRANAWYAGWFGSQGPTGKHGFTYVLPALDDPTFDTVAVEALTLQPYAVRWCEHVRMFSHREDAIRFAQARKRSAVFHLAPKTRKIACADQVLTRSDPRSARDSGPRKGAAMVVGGESSRTMSHYVVIGVEETRIWY